MSEVFTNSNLRTCHVKATRNPLNLTVVAKAKGGSSSSFPVLGLLRPVTDATKLNPSVFSNLPKFFLPFGWYFKIIFGILQMENMNEN
jgi:hypothetical protein